MADPLKIPAASSVVPGYRAARETLFSTSRGRFIAASTVWHSEAVETAQRSREWEAPPPWSYSGWPTPAGIDRGFQRGPGTSPRSSNARLDPLLGKPFTKDRASGGSGRSWCPRRSDRAHTAAQYTATRSRTARSAAEASLGAERAQGARWLEHRVGAPSPLDGLGQMPHWRVELWPGAA